jgi:long-chain acyl-CoA synthetase
MLRAFYEEARCDETFLVYADDRLTYVQAWQQACRIAHALVNDYGITKGDRVAIAMRNYPEWVTAFMAITSIGGIAVLLNAHWKAPEIEYAIANSEPRVIFADQERIERLSQCTKRATGLAIMAARSTSLPSQARHFADVIDEHEAVEMPAVELDPVDDATIFFTSGSTGHPKGALSCHLNILSAPLGWELEVEIAMRTTGFVPEAEEAQPERNAVPNHGRANLPIGNLDRLDQCRRALSAADAHRDDAVFLAAPFQFAQQMSGHA